MIVRLTLADLPGDQPIIFNSEYFLSAKPIFKDGSRKYTKVRLKTNIVCRVKESVDEVQQRLDAAT